MTPEEFKDLQNKINGFHKSHLYDISEVCRDNSLHFLFLVNQSNIQIPECSVEFKNRIVFSWYWFDIEDRYHTLFVRFQNNVTFNHTHTVYTSITYSNGESLFSEISLNGVKTFSLLGVIPNRESRTKTLQKKEFSEISNKLKILQSKWLAYDKKYQVNNSKSKGIIKASQEVLRRLVGKQTPEYGLRGLRRVYFRWRWKTTPGFRVQAQLSVADKNILDFSISFHGTFKKNFYPVPFVSEALYILRKLPTVKYDA